MADLEELYREIILDHYRNPRNRGELEPPATRTEGFNPLCGDEIVLSLLVESDRIVDVKIAGSGCSISQSSGSLMSAAIKGKTVEEARALIGTFKQMLSLGDNDEVSGDAEPAPINLRSLGELAALQGVAKFPVRIKCATLSWNTLAQGLEEQQSA
jgi:nitrogen fixation NifU-like protein